MLTPIPVPWQGPKHPNLDPGSQPTLMLSFICFGFWQGGNYPASQIQGFLIPVQMGVTSSAETRSGTTTGVPGARLDNNLGHTLHTKYGVHECLNILDDTSFPKPRSCCYAAMRAEKG